MEDGEELIRKVTWISEEEFLQNVEKPDGIKKLCGQCKENDLGADEKDPLPLYISIDKDILSESEGKTNWDQGNVASNQVLHFIDAYMQQTPDKTLIGVDVCGEDRKQTVRKFRRSAGKPVKDQQLCNDIVKAD